MTGMIGNDLLQRVVRSYFDVSHEIEIESISEGLTNYNFKLTTQSGKHYFLKIFRTANLRRVESIVNLSFILKEYNFPTPEIICMKNRQMYWTDNKRSALLTEFIAGRYPEKNIPDLYQIGNVLGALHLIPSKIPLEKGYPLNFENQMTSMIQSGEPVENDLNIFLEETTPFLNKLKNLEFPESIIHGDVFLDNLLVSEFGDIFFVDFEGGCLDKSIFDLSRAVIGCTIIRNRIDLNLARALITGYDLVRSLKDIEREYLYEYIVYAGVVSTLWRYNEFNIKRKIESKGQLYRKLMNPVADFLNHSRLDFQKLIFN